LGAKANCVMAGKEKIEGEVNCYLRRRERRPSSRGERETIIKKKDDAPTISHPSPKAGKESPEDGSEAGGDLAMD